MSQRATTCCIPGCRRSTGRIFAEWICAKHWARATKAEKRVWARIKRQDRRHPVNDARFDRVWLALKHRCA